MPDLRFSSLKNPTSQNLEFRLEGFFEVLFHIEAKKWGKEISYLLAPNTQKPV